MSSLASLLVLWCSLPTYSSLRFSLFSIARGDKNLASQIESMSDRGKEALGIVENVAVKLHELLQKVETSSYVRDILNRVSYKKPPPKVKAKNVLAGLQLVMDRVTVFLGKVAGLGSCHTRMLWLEGLVLRDYVTRGEVRI